MEYRFTDYFENKVLAKRPYLTKEMCIAVVEARPTCQAPGRGFSASAARIRGGTVAMAALARTW
jgi:hypothetical protein